MRITEGRITKLQCTVTCVITISFGSCKSALQESAHSPCIILLGNLHIHTSSTGVARSDHGPRPTAAWRNAQQLGNVMCVKLTKQTRNASCRVSVLPRVSHPKLQNGTWGPGSSVDIATDYGLGGTGIESRWGRDYLQTSGPALGPTQPPVQWVPGLSRG
jgi:hypothetical protein